MCVVVYNRSTWTSLAWIYDYVIDVLIMMVNTDYLEAITFWFYRN